MFRNIGFITNDLLQHTARTSHAMHVHCVSVSNFLWWLYQPLTDFENSFNIFRNIFKLLCFTPQCNKDLRNGEYYYIYLTIYCCFHLWKNFQNRLTVENVNIKSSTPRFFLRHSVAVSVASRIRVSLSAQTCKKPSQKYI